MHTGTVAVIAYSMTIFTKEVRMKLNSSGWMATITGARLSSEASMAPFKSILLLMLKAGTAKLFSWATASKSLIFINIVGPPDSFSKKERKWLRAA
jgi:hypothetical protein